MNSELYRFRLPRFFNPIFELKIGRGSERKRATEPRKKNTKTMYSRG